MSLSLGSHVIWFVPSGYSSAKTVIDGMDTAKTPAVAIAVNFVRNFFCILNLLVHKKIVTTNITNIRVLTMWY